MMWNWGACPDYQSNYMMGYYGLGGGFGIISMILWWVLIAAAVMLILRWTVHATGRRSGRDESLKILRERYARSEIKQSEFEEMKRNLER